MFWVPQSGDIGMGVSHPELRRRRAVRRSSPTAALCPDPQKIIDRFEPEFAKLLLLTLMLPWQSAAAVA